MNRDEVLDVLRTKDGVLIEFTKLDGSERKMKCTLKQELIPEDSKPKGNGDVPVNEEIIKVWDLEKKGWRCFRVEAVTSVGWESE